MPIYQAKCDTCGTVQEYYAPVAQCHVTPECCGGKTEKVILTAPMGFVSHIAYTSPIDGRPITTKQARADDLARSNCRPWEGMEQERKEASRRQAYAEQAQDAKLERCIADTLASMEPEKKQALGVI